MNDLKIGDKIITPSGCIDEIEIITDGIYWLKSGLYAFNFELRRYNNEY